MQQPTNGKESIDWVVLDEGSFSLIVPHMVALLGETIAVYVCAYRSVPVWMPPAAVWYRLK